MTTDKTIRCAMCGDKFPHSMVGYLPGILPDGAGVWLCRGRCLDRFRSQVQAIFDEEKQRIVRRYDERRKRAGRARPA